MNEHLRANREMWDDRAPVHAASAGYGLARYASDPAHLSDVVRFDLPRLGDLRGLDVVHLQCHLGTDTLSLVRLGARATGLDFSAPALEAARALAPEVRFVQADVHDAVEVLGAASYDVVFTGVGALCWLPSAARWAQVVAGLLRPGGRLHLREGHPVLWSLDDERGDGVLALEHPARTMPEPLAWTGSGTYVDVPGPLTTRTSYEWNHSLAEVVTALLDAGLRLTLLVEHDSVPWEALPGLMEELPGGEWRLRDRPERLPHSYTLQAVKPG